MKILNHIGSLSNVDRNMVGRAVLCIIGICRPWTQENGPAAGAAPGLHVPSAVANHPRLLQVEVHRLGRRQQHARLRFP